MTTSANVCSVAGGIYRHDVLKSRHLNRHFQQPLQPLPSLHLCDRVFPYALGVIHHGMTTCPRRAASTTRPLVGMLICEPGVTSLFASRLEWRCMWPSPGIRHIEALSIITDPLFLLLPRFWTPRLRIAAEIYVLLEAHNTIHDPAGRDSYPCISQPWIYLCSALVIPIVGVLFAVGTGFTRFTTLFNGADIFLHVVIAHVVPVASGTRHLGHDIMFEDVLVAQNRGILDELEVSKGVCCKSGSRRWSDSPERCVPATPARTPTGS